MISLGLKRGPDSFLSSLTTGVEAYVITSFRNISTFVGSRWGTAEKSEGSDQNPIAVAPSHRPTLNNGWSSTRARGGAFERSRKIVDDY